MLFSSSASFPAGDSISCSSVASCVVGAVGEGGVGCVAAVVVVVVAGASVSQSIDTDPATTAIAVAVGPGTSITVVVDDDGAVVTVAVIDGDVSVVAAVTFSSSITVVVDDDGDASVTVAVIDGDASSVAAVIIASITAAVSCAEFIVAGSGACVSPLLSEHSKESGACSSPLCFCAERFITFSASAATAVGAVTPGAVGAVAPGAAGFVVAARLRAATVAVGSGAGALHILSLQSDPGSPRADDDDDDDDVAVVGKLGEPTASWLPGRVVTLRLEDTADGTRLCGAKGGGILAGRGYGGVGGTYE